MVSMNPGNLSAMATQAQTGLADASLINQTLKHFNGGANPAADASLSVIADATKNLVNAALGKGLNVDSMA